MKRSRPSQLRRELKFIVECGICGGKGERLGIFHYLECEACLGTGWVCGHTLKSLPLIDVVNVLNARLKDALSEIAKARPVTGGAHEQYSQNNRRGAGGTNFTGD